MNETKTQSKASHHSIADFLAMLAAERNASRNTIDSYRRDLEDAAAFLNRDGHNLHEADSAALRAFLQSLAQRSLTASTQARKLSALRQYYRFLQADRLRGDDPTLVLQPPRQQRPLPKILTLEHMARLFTTADTAAKDEGLSASTRLRAARLLALLELLYATGLRISELVALPASIEHAPGLFTVRGKGNKERLLPLPEPALEALKIYRAQMKAMAKPKAEASPWLFPAQSDSGHMTRQNAARDLKALAMAAGLPHSAVSPHIIRHAFASHMLQNGADLRSLQQLLGHADIATTQIYTHLLDERLAGLVRDHHPLND